MIITTLGFLHEYFDQPGTAKYWYLLSDYVFKQASLSPCFMANPYHMLEHVHWRLNQRYY